MFPNLLSPGFCSGFARDLGSYLVILTPRVLVLGSGAFRRWRETEVFVKETLKAGLLSPGGRTQEDNATSEPGQGPSSHLRSAYA